MSPGATYCNPLQLDSDSTLEGRQLMASTLTMMIDREDYHSEPLLEDPSTGTFILEKHFKTDTLPSQSSSTELPQPFTTFVGPSNTMARILPGSTRFDCGAARRSAVGQGVAR
jgi:hypothetical protein